MMKYAVAVVALFAVGCGSGGGDGDSSEAQQGDDNRVCIINDSFNNEPDLQLAVSDEAEQQGLETVENLGDQPDFAAKGISICGDPITVEAAIGDDSVPNLSSFLATGREVQ